MIIKSTKPVLLKVYYWMPDHPSLLQEFSWGFEDHIPELLRTHNFLNYWHKSIDAVIAEILISVSGDQPKTYCAVSELYSLN
jgi:uncharacterized protein Usg